MRNWAEFICIKPGKKNIFFLQIFLLVEETYSQTNKKCLSSFFNIQTISLSQNIKKETQFNHFLSNLSKNEDVDILRKTMYSKYLCKTLNNTL